MLGKQIWSVFHQFILLRNERFSTDGTSVRLYRKFEWTDRKVLFDERKQTIIHETLFAIKFDY